MYIALAFFCRTHLSLSNTHFISLICHVIKQYFPQQFQVTFKLTFLCQHPIRFVSLNEYINNSIIALA